MKINIVLLATLFFSLLKIVDADEYKMEMYFSNKFSTINFPDIGKVIQITNDFTWKDSLGNYGKGVCYGTVESSSEGRDNLKYFCEMNDQDDESFFTKGERLSDEVEVGVGTQSIIDGIGKWKTFVGSKCTYGVKYKDNVVFASSKCIM